MDYIREELLRQQAALTALLLGIAGETPAADSALQRKDRESPEVPEALKDTETLEEPESRTRTQAWLAQTAGAGAKTELQASEERTETPLQSTGGSAWYHTGETEPAAETVQRYWTFGGEGVQPFETAAPQTPGKSHTSGTVDFLWPVQERRGSDARDISLALERDARRYDGGFSLY